MILGLRVNAAGTVWVHTETNVMFNWTLKFLNPIVPISLHPRYSIPTNLYRMANLALLSWPHQSPAYSRQECDKTEWPRQGLKQLRVGIVRRE